MIMVMLGTIIMIVFMVVFSELYNDNYNDKKRILAEDFGYYLQTEFVLASEAKPGYSRTFDVPVTLEGFEYNAYIINNVLIINYTEGAYPFTIPEVEGILYTGPNTIRNINNSICLNC